MGDLELARSALAGHCRRRVGAPAQGELRALDEPFGVQHVKERLPRRAVGGGESARVALVHEMHQELVVEMEAAVARA